MLSTALKEWAIVCDLLLEGRQAILLRKGGIHEASGPGVFELEQPRFGLFPSWAHQNPQSIKEAYRSRVRVVNEPEQIPIRGFAEVTKVWRVPSRGAFDQLDDVHCWTEPYVDMRFHYKPERPLYLMALRVFRLAEPKVIRNEAEYAGCKSWVPLRPGDEIDDTPINPVMDDWAIEALVTRIDHVFSEAAASGKG